MPIDKWERLHRANIKKGVADINRQLSLNANRIAHKIKILQSKQALSARKYGTQILRNQTLLKSISEEFYNLEGNVNKSLAGLTKSAWDLANKKNDADLLKYESLKDMFKKSWTQPNTNAYNAFMKRNVGGLNLSERIHNYTEQNKQLYLDYIGSGITQGKSAAEIARELNKINNDPENVTVFDRNGEPKKMGLTSKLLVDGAQGQGIYKSPLKNLIRVTRHETNVAYRMSDFERRQDLDFVVGIQVHLSNSHHVDDMCDPLEGKYPKDFKFYSWHILCMCYTTSILATLEEMNAYFKTGEMKAANEVKDIPARSKKWVKDTGEKANKFDFVKNNSKYINGVSKTNPITKSITPIAPKKDAFIPAKTIQEAETFAKNTGVDFVDYKGWNIMHANAMNESLSLVPKAAKPNLITNFAGYNKTFSIPIKGRQLKNNYGVSLNGFDLKVDTKLLTNELRDKYSKSFYKILDNQTTGTSVIFGNNQMVAMNTKYFKLPNLITARKAEINKLMISKGNNPYYLKISDDKFTHLHELGHIFDSNVKASGKLKNSLNLWHKESKLGHLAPNMDGDFKEAFADAFADFFSTGGKNLPDYLLKDLTEILK